MLTEKQLKMAEQAALNTFSTDPRIAMLASAVLDLIGEVRQRRALDGDPAPKSVKVGQKYAPQS